MSDPLFEENLRFLQQRHKSLKDSGAPKEEVIHAAAVVHMMAMVKELQPLIFDCVDEAKANRNLPNDKLEVKAVKLAINTTAQLAGNLMASVVASISHHKPSQKTLAAIAMKEIANSIIFTLSDQHGEMILMEYDDDKKPKPFDFRQHITP